LLHVELDYPAERLEELHDWYNTEHVPERLGIPGFLSGRRYAAIEGGPRWLALYEVARPSVLESDDYRRWRGAGQSAWTARILPRNRRFRRTVYALTWSDPDEAGAPEPAGGPAGLLSLRLSPLASGAGAELLRGEITLRSLLGCAGVGRVRVYRDVAEPGNRLGLCELNGIWAVQQPEFRVRWSRIMTVLDRASVSYSRGLYVRIL